MLVDAAVAVDADVDVDVAVVERLS